jgi:hypothetical protein
MISTQRLALQITMKSSCQCLFNHPGTQLKLFSGQSESQSHIATDGQSISKSCRRVPDMLRLWSCFSEAHSLTRGRVCLLYMLLALASIVFLGLESLWTRDDILLSQIWDFPFRRLLWLAGSRWRYSNPPPHELVVQADSCYIAAQTMQKTQVMW